MTFWDHLDELRTVLIRILAVVAVFTIVSFLFKVTPIGTPFWTVFDMTERIFRVRNRKNGSWEDRGAGNF